MIYNGMCNNTKIDKTGRKIGKKSKELYILNVNDILNDFLTFFLLLNMSFYIFPNPPLPVYQIFTRRGNNQDKYNPGITRPTRTCADLTDFKKTALSPYPFNLGS